MAGGDSLGIRIWTCASVCMLCVFVCVYISPSEHAPKAPSRGDVHIRSFIINPPCSMLSPPLRRGPPEVCAYFRSFITPSDIHPAAALNTEKTERANAIHPETSRPSVVAESTIRYPRSMIHNVTVTASVSHTAQWEYRSPPPARQRATPPQPAVGSGSAFSSFSPSAGSVGGRYCARLPST